MKFARTITLDESDSRIFETVATAGEWAISGTFEFANLKEEQIDGNNVSRNLIKSELLIK